MSTYRNLKTPLSRPFDSGLQPERTALAWRRTAIAVVVAGLLALRYFPEALGPIAAVAALGCIGLGIGALLSADRRYRRTHRTLTSSHASEAVPGDGLGMAVVAGASALAGALCLAFVLSLGVPRIL